MLSQLPFESSLAIDHLHVFYREIKQLQDQMRLSLTIIQESWSETNAH